MNESKKIAASRFAATRPVSTAHACSAILSLMHYVLISY